MVATDTIIFNTGTQAQANDFAGGQVIFDGGIKPIDISVTDTPGTILTNEAITLTAGGHSLTFGATALEGSDITFTGSDGQLVFGATGLADLNSAGDDQSVAYGFAGDDIITANGANTGSWVVDGGAGNDAIDFSAQTDTTTGHYLFGGAGDDTITGSAGNDHIYGNALTSVAGAADGNDIITLGNGNNYVNGNAGDDTIHGGAGSNRIYGGAGNDIVDVTGVGSNHVNGNKGDDTINAATATGNNDLHGGAGNDVITSGTGHDTLSGDLGDDHLIVSGGAADHHLTVLTGGDGADTFDFSAAGAGTAVDIAADGTAGAGTWGAHTFYQEVTDFTAGTDHLHLAAAFTPAAAANLVVSDTNFASVSTAHDAAVTALTGGVVAVATQVGDDTYLFYDAGNEVIKLDHTTASSIDIHSFA